MMQITARSPRRIVRLAVAASVYLAARAASAETPVDAPPSPPPVHASYQTWTSLTVQGPIADRLLFLTELHGRFYDDMHPFQVLLYPALGYRLPHGFSVFAGYAFTPSWNEEREYAEEHRAWQQIVYEAPFTQLRLVGRARLEERVRAGSDVGYLLRTMVRLEVPLGLPVPLRTVLWEELFWGLDQPAAWQPEPIDQDLLFVGFGWVLGPHLRTDVGYLGQVLPRRDATTAHHSLAINAVASW